MRKAFTALFLIVLIPLLTTAHHLRGAADDEKPTTQPYDWTPLDKVIGVKGEFKNDVCTFVLPRTDLTVAVDSMEVPIAAGIASEFHFFRCSCGKMRVVGQFCCVDYETNDVIDAIRVGSIIEVTNVGPMFNTDRPRISIVRFQGEGDAQTLAKLLKSALGWIGDARNAPLPGRK
jgi:hypothetical protein